MTNRKRWNQRLRDRIWWANDRWEDRVLDWTDRPGVPDKLGYGIATLLTPLGANRARRAMCWLLQAHQPIEDHCMKPEHDYCIRCEKPMPFQGPNVEKRQAWLASQREKYGKGTTK